MSRDYHACHHPRCTKQVPPHLFACSVHWFSLPIRLRNAILRTYRKGQEVDKRPSDEYKHAAIACLDYWRGEL